MIGFGFDLVENHMGSFDHTAQYRGGYSLARAGETPPPRTRRRSDDRISTGV